MADNVFVPVVYRAIAARIEAMTISDFSYLSGHDVYGTTLTSTTPWPLHFFLSRPWHDLLAGLFGIRSTRFINCGVHRHEVRSADGFAHNDLNPGWYLDDPESDGVVLPQPGLCDYTTGVVRAGARVASASVRAVALIYYVANGEWRPGDGGETALYRSGRGPVVDRPAETIAPVDNRLVAFECTPSSYHGFQSNKVRPRNSIVMWLHQPWEYAAGRWGRSAIISYGAASKR